LAPVGQRRMSDNPHANGGLLLRDLKMPDCRDYAVSVPSPGQTHTDAARGMGKFRRDIMKMNRDSKKFRRFSPDEKNAKR
ncbi:phosphoketolase, partial [Rhizobium ruizarguesonis]